MTDETRRPTPYVTPPALLRRIQLPTTKGGQQAEDEYAEAHRRLGDSTLKLRKKYYER